MYMYSNSTRGVCREDHVGRVRRGGVGHVCLVGKKTRVCPCHVLVCLESGVETAQVNGMARHDAVDGEKLHAHEQVLRFDSSPRALQRAGECVAVCCSVLKRVAVCCSVLQCVAVCCSVLQCVAVCSSGAELRLRAPSAARTVL